MNNLANILSSRARAEIFRLLFGVNPQELHIRELARQARLNAMTVRQELRKLAGLGLVTARKSGNRTYHRANDRHPLYPEIHALVLKTNGLVDVLRRALRKGNAKVAFVFGSIAAGSDKPGSDVDLMVVGATSLRKVTDQLGGVDARIGREINPHVFTPAELARRRADNDHFLTTVLSGPKLFVIGNEDELAAAGPIGRRPPA